MTSAYPASIEALLGPARTLADELGRTPSRNQIMAELHVGRDKARAVLAALESDPGARPRPSEEQVGPARRLHSVPTTPSDPGPDDPADTGPTAAPAPGAAGAGTDPAPVPDEPSTVVSAQVGPVAAPGPDTAPAAASGGRVRDWWGRVRRARTHPGPGPAGIAGGVVRRWPLLLLALPAFVAIWSGWVGLGEMTGFGPVHPLPGIASGFSLNTAITLPIGVETYAAFALRVWLAGAGAERARSFARISAIGALVLGAAGQVAYHLMTARHITAAPWPITTAVACLPVIVLGAGAALAHLQHATDTNTTDPRGTV